MLIVYKWFTPWPIPVLFCLKIFNKKGISSPNFRLNLRLCIRAFQRLLGFGHNTFDYRVFICYVLSTHSLMIPDPFRCLLRTLFHLELEGELPFHLKSFHFRLCTRFRVSILVLYSTQTGFFSSKPQTMG